MGSGSRRQADRRPHPRPEKKRRHGRYRRLFSRRYGAAQR